MTLLPVVSGAPAWAARNPLDGGSSPRDPQDYSRFLQVLMQRYGPAGSLWAENPGVKARPVRRWQIWNEPNLKYYWAEQPYAPEYVQLLKAAHATIHAADPGATVITAGLPNTSWNDVRAIYDFGGKGAFDAIALHPYTLEVRNVLRVVDKVRKVQKRFHDASRAVWLTELCWPASRGRGGQPFVGKPWETSERGQATKLGQAMRLLAGARKSRRIGGVLWYTWLSWEDTHIPAFWPSYCGLRRVTRRGKLVSSPALKTFRGSIARLER